MDRISVGFVGGTIVLFLVHGLIKRRRLKGLSWLARSLFSWW